MPGTKLPIYVGVQGARPEEILWEARTAEVLWVASSGTGEVEALTKWVEWTPIRTPREAASADFAWRAAQIWEADRREGLVAGSLAEMNDVIAADPKTVKTGLLVVTADWFEFGILGFCLFYRNWDNELRLEFLSAHPAVDRLCIGGVGTGLVYSLLGVAEQVKAKAVFGETTADSVGFYRAILDSPHIMGRLRVGRRKMCAFRKKMGRKWRGEKTPWWEWAVDRMKLMVLYGFTYGRKIIRRTVD